MSAKKHVRDLVIKSLSAIGAEREAKFYAELFAQQSPEKFALIVLDPRCLKNPLLEALTSNLRILSDLSLTPILLIGALGSDRTRVKFMSQRLFKELDGMGVRAIKLNTASYQLFPEVRKLTAKGQMPILEFTDAQQAIDLEGVINELQPAKVIFLQPSGGISINGERVPFINIDKMDERLQGVALSKGQKTFQSLVTDFLNSPLNTSVYIMASPLNLLRELFTTRGSGTLVRRGAPLLIVDSLSGLDESRLVASISGSFEKRLNPSFFETPINSAIVERDYRGGAILKDKQGLAYLSKFWVTREAQGEGIARDIWDATIVHQPRVFWRSRETNSFNNWYMKMCHGMQQVAGWRVFWRGLDTQEIPLAVNLASSASDDFEH
ncbi:MAG: hypothetical protein ABJ275_08515 [Maricaulaceae bacterium]